MRLSIADICDKSMRFRIGVVLAGNLVMPPERKRPAVFVELE